MSARAILSNQYTYDESLSVFDLADGRSYSVASLESPFPGSGATVGDPPTPGPWPLQTSVLGSDGRAARLFDTYPPGSNASEEAAPSGEILEVVGFHRYHRVLVRAGAGTIDPGSVTFAAQTVSWTQDGDRHSSEI